ncbi:MAG TPA: type VI secretion system-associated FHA domain protein TagH [Telluria sp.]
MTVTLHVVRYRDETPAQSLACIFGPNGGTLGRAADNDMVFDDPERSVSRRHARIDYCDGRYCILDLGANQSLVNQQPLGPGRQIGLADGDVICIGHYQLRASVASDPLPALRLAAPQGGDALAAASILRPDDACAPAAAWPWGPAAVQSQQSSRSDHFPAERMPFPSMTIPENYDPLADTAPRGCDAASDPVARALLRGLGLPGMPQGATGMPAEELAELAGAMLREATAGIMAAAAARGTSRRESGLGAHKEQEAPNNPLLAQGDAASALARMIAGAAGTAMAPCQAYADAFDQVEAHELAVMAGLRAALAGVVASFDPAAIEARIGAPSLAHILFPARHKARLWQSLVDTSARLAADAEDDFQRLFAQAFGWQFERASSAVESTSLDGRRNVVE